MFPCFIDTCVHSVLWQAGGTQGCDDAHVAVVRDVGARPVHVADGAQQQVRQRLVERLEAVQQLVRDREQQPALAPQAQRQA